MAIVVESPADLLGMVGVELGTTDWVALTQDRIDRFADATGDHQWIHVDVDRALAESPFGGPVAHGYLTLSLVNLFLPELLEVRGASMGVNVGLERVRFPAPVPAGSRVRGAGAVLSASQERGGIQVLVRVTVQVEAEETPGEPRDRPGCVADTISRFFP